MERDPLAEVLRLPPVDRADAQVVLARVHHETMDYRVPP
jgi:hypothetical protein